MTTQQMVGWVRKVGEHNFGYARIDKVRAAMNIPRHEFDATLEEAWDAGLVYPTAGNNEGMTMEEVNNCYKDSNGFLHINLRETPRGN